MKGKMLRKLKSISTSTLKQGLVFHSNLQNHLFQPSTNFCQFKNETLPKLIPTKNTTFSQLMNDAKEESFSSDSESKPEFPNSQEEKPTFQSDPTSKPCFFNAKTMENNENPQTKEQIHDDEIKGQADFNPKTIEDKEKHQETEEVQDVKIPSLFDFEESCPPGGADSVIFYTTSLRGVRKTFDECSSIRFLLESLGILYYERDVSMHLGYREELWRVLGNRVVPPRLFVRGRYIGGADEVVTLHEQGMLKKLLHGIPLSPSKCPCWGCGGMHFLLCFRCNGSRKIASAEGEMNFVSVRCPDCNENGLVKCSICSS